MGKHNCLEPRERALEKKKLEVGSGMNSELTQKTWHGNMDSEETLKIWRGGGLNSE